MVDINNQILLYTYLLYIYIYIIKYIYVFIYSMCRCIDGIIRPFSLDSSIYDKSFLVN